MITRESDGVWINLEETIATHHDEVFGLLTTSGGLTRWLCLNARVDMRTGGTIVFGWDRKGERHTTVAILDYDPGGKVVWDWYADSGDMHAPVYWTVEPSREQGSRVKLRQGPFREDVDALLVMADEAQTWRWHLCNMRSTLEAQHDMRRVRPL
jgi:uncharacterized protein YndB with AHSA1/START domain